MLLIDSQKPSQDRSKCVKEMSIARFSKSVRYLLYSVNIAGALIGFKYPYGRFMHVSSHRNHISHLFDF